MSSIRRQCNGKDTVLSRRQIESLIAQKHTIIIVDDKVLKVDPWLKYHPGGDLAIMHMVGRDATDEVNALHSVEALGRMKCYQVGRIEKPWTNFLPPIQGGKFRDDEQEEEGLVGSDSDSSVESSEAPSPIFDPIDKLPSSLQPGGILYGSDTPRTSSISSISSDEEDTKERSTPSFMDIRTQEEINLDLSQYPPLDPLTQAHIVQKYRDLNKQIRAEGLYDCRYRSYILELFRYGLLFGLCIFFLRRGWYGTSGMFLGMFWHQLVFTAHDAGHMGITHDFTIDTIIGIVVADFLGGLSLGWWKRSHNVHHVVTNSPEHDPDTELMPFFAISHRFFSSLHSTYYDRVMTYDLFARLAIRYQAYLYYPILAFGRFNLYALSWSYLLMGQGPRKGPARWHRWFEISGHIFFWAWFGYGILYCAIPSLWQRVLFVLTSHMMTTPLHVQITLSHFAMSTADLGPAESFPQKMLRTTMDVDCPAWLDFFHGGLQFQAIHHLYPRIPRHNLRRTQTLVRRFCEEVEIPYALYGFAQGNRKVIGRLADVGRQARILEECRRRVVRDGGGHH
ncbi:MAG: hypothetical protein M1816_003436 [Peltula sp. TS41687]|nr:MAG: hypothetical protein M1816_003436 [Peltula sp. TS41687]